jgi:hypothetical protein
MLWLAANKGKPKYAGPELGGRKTESEGVADGKTTTNKKSPIFQNALETWRGSTASK